MPELVILGTAVSVPDAEHDTVALVLRGPEWAVLIECSGSSLYKLAQVGIPRDHLSAVILTHRHADHVYGLPMLVQGAWLGGRTTPLPIYGPQETLDIGLQMLQLYDLDKQANMFPLLWRPVPLREDQHVLTLDGVRITAWPTCHGDLDTLALRLENEARGTAIVYSSDRAQPGCGAPGSRRRPVDPRGHRGPRWAFYTGPSGRGRPRGGRIAPGLDSLSRRRAQP